MPGEMEIDQVELTRKSSRRCTNRICLREWMMSRTEEQSEAYPSREVAA